MTVLALNHATVAKLTKLSDAEASPYWDSDLKGFGLRLHVDANNKLLRSFVIQYRFGNRQRKINLGDAAKITVRQAREKAKKLFGQVANGVDPAEVKEEQRRASTALLFRDGVAQYLDLQEKRLRPVSFKNAKLYLTGEQYFGNLHRMPVNEVTRSHVSAAIDKIVSRGTTVTASRCRAWLSAFFVWCLERGHADSNPVINSAKVKAAPARDRVLSDDELRKVWNACKDDGFGKVVKLLILTGCRRQEIGGLSWSEIDMDAGTLTIPGTRTKNKRAHTLPITPAMREIVESVPRRVDRDYVFGERAVGFTGWKKKCDFAHGIEKPWTLHDLRRTVATGMADDALEIDPHIVEAVLNHASGHKAGDAGTYNRARYAKQIARALNLWGDHVRSVVTEQPRKVVSFKQTA
jgi:integrase